MMRSMTGYGRARAGADAMTATVEIRSVNSRQREVRFRLPQVLLAGESRWREQVQETVARGRVDVMVALEGERAAASRLKLNLVVAGELVQAWRRLEEEFDLDGGPRAEVLLRLPGVLESATIEEEQVEELFSLVDRALVDALAAFDASRRREGETLLADLRLRERAVRDAVARVRKLAGPVPARLAAELRRRVEELLGETAVDPARVAQEAALLAQRADVTEELVRLAAHLDRLEELFSGSTGEIGRAAEFLVQEIRREVNTIGSKASDPAVDEQVLRIKGELEKIREQAANLE
ncbi:MAG: YicC/YloC family endoribonuclease [Acidobacteriota bacterium]|nr:YicC/YloC family endoribonuclease [Acidobacteriota bacterium]